MGRVRLDPDEVHQQAAVFSGQAGEDIDRFFQLRAGIELCHRAGVERFAPPQVSRKPLES